MCKYLLGQNGINKIIKLGGCLEAASELTNVTLSSARTWTRFATPFNWTLLENNSFKYT